MSKRVELWREAWQQAEENAEIAVFQAEAMLRQFQQARRAALKGDDLEATVNAEVNCILGAFNVDQAAARLVALRTLKKEHEG